MFNFSSMAGEKNFNKNNFETCTYIHIKKIYIYFFFLNKKKGEKKNSNEIINFKQTLFRCFRFHGFPFDTKVPFFFFLSTAISDVLEKEYFARFTNVKIDIFRFSAASVPLAPQSPPTIIRKRLDVFYNLCRPSIPRALPTR